MRGLLVTVGLTFWASCQNPYTQFYTDQVPPGEEKWLQPHTGEAQFVPVPDAALAATVRQYNRQGYEVIGASAFEAAAKNYRPALRAKAKEVQADIVLLSQAYAGTVSGVIPLTTYQPGQVSTTYNSGQVNANAHGSGGYANATANYSGTSTTVGPATSTTTYIPYNVTRNTYNALFLRRRYFVAGWNSVPLTDDQRHQLQRNTGVMLEYVVDGSPAFRANILSGDILLAIDDIEFGGISEVSDIILRKAGQSVDLTIVREGVVKHIKLKLNPLPPEA